MGFLLPLKNGSKLQPILLKDPFFFLKWVNSEDNAKYLEWYQIYRRIMKEKKKLSVSDQSILNVTLERKVDLFNASSLSF